MKKTVMLLMPLLIFAVLLIPYSLINQAFIVEWFGCGCPIVDEFGNVVENPFNANDFTAIFWLVIAICATAISVFLSGKIFQDKMRLRLLYIAATFIFSLLIAKGFCQIMMWK